MKLTGYEKISMGLALVFIVIIILYNSLRYISNEDAIIEMAGITSVSSNEISLTASSNTNSNQNKIININTATKEELMELEGIGEVKALSIIDDREINGNFNSVDEIVRVDGIGESTLNKIRQYITIE